MPFSPIRLATLLAFAVSVVLFGASPSLAQEPTPGQLAAARELIAATGALSTVDDMLPAFSDQVKKQAVTRPDLAKDLDEVLKSLEPEMQLQRAQILSEVAKTYSKYLSEAEMRDVIAFFKTPAGSKYINVQPQLIDDVVNEVTAWSEQTSEYVVTRARAEMAKRGHQMQ